MPITVGGFSVVLADRVRETTQTTGTGTYALDGAVAGRRTFVLGVGNGNRTTYTVAMGSNWETGIGLVTSGAPSTLSRAAILASSNSGSAVNWGAGIKDVFVDVTAAVFDALQTNFESTAVNRHKTTVLTSSGTFTRDADCMFASVRIVGGGAAGGGTPVTSTSGAAAGGGGAGQYAEGWFTAAQIGTSQTVTIGAGGTGVSAAQGNNGGTTSFGALMTAFGGTGGAQGLHSATNEVGGGAGGTGGTGGTFRVQGGSGTGGAVRSGAFLPLGNGGVSMLGGGTNEAIGQLYGAGGGGRYIGFPNAALAGFAGAAGVCIVVEFCRI